MLEYGGWVGDSAMAEGVGAACSARHKNPV